MNVQTQAKHLLDYQPCRYGGTKIAFRGPHKMPKGNYVTFLGGTETFGPYIASPYPELIEKNTGLTCINLGCRDGGIDSYLMAPGLIDLCTAGAATVIEVTGAQNMSNRFYVVDPRRNNRVIRASKLMKSIFYDIDFTLIDTTDQLISTIAHEAKDRLPLLRQEIQSSWVSRMRNLIHAIQGPTILLWAADHAPFSASRGGSICREPLFVDRAMLDAVLGAADQLVEVVISQDDVAAGFNEMHVNPNDISAAAALLGPVAHRQIRTAMLPALSQVLGRDSIAPMPCLDAAM